MAIRICGHCGQRVFWNKEVGDWVHGSENGSRYVMTCPECGWKGPGPYPITYETDICPNCGVQGKLQDDHVVNPQVVS